MNALFNLIAEKPYIGFSLTGAGFLSGLLTLLKVLTPILGFVGAALGVAAGVFTLLIKYREWKQGRLK